MSKFEYSHYSELIAMAIDFARPDPEPGQIEFYRKYLDKVDGPYLELASGTGRILYPLKKIGYDIEGVDSSQEMLERCKFREEKFGVKVKMYQQFMQDFKIDKKYGLILIADCSFALLVDPKDQIVALKNIYMHLKPGGILLFDVMTLPDKKEKEVGTDFNYAVSPDEKQIVISRSIFKYDSITHKRYGTKTQELYEDGVFKYAKTFLDPMRFDDPQDVCKLLEEAGFAEIKVAKYLSDDHLGDEMPSTVSIRCRKPMN